MAKYLFLRGKESGTGITVSYSAKEVALVMIWSVLVNMLITLEVF